MILVTAAGAAYRLAALLAWPLALLARMSSYSIITLQQRVRLPCSACDSLRQIA